LAKLADVATGNALISGGIGVAPSYGKIGLTTHVSGVLPVANGGTNASTASITSFNNITGYTASGATGTTSTNLVFSTSPSITTPTLVGDVTVSTGNVVIGTSGKGITDSTGAATLNFASTGGTFNKDVVINGLTVGKGASAISTNSAFGVNALQGITTGGVNSAIGSQGFFGPGLVGNFKDQGDGVQTRKVGTYGMRRTEYLVNNDTTGGHSVMMNAKEAKKAGINIPPRANGMNMGAQMGIGMAGSMGGMALMQQEKVGGMTGMQAGMGLMVASSILPMLPYARMSTGIKAAGGALKAFKFSLEGLKRGIALVGRLAKGFGLVGAAITAATAVFQIWKGIQDSKQDASMGLSLTAKAAEQAGIKYTSLNEQMTLLIENKKLELAAAKGGEGISAGMPGLAMSVKEMKTAKEEGKKLKDFIESLNRSEGFDETLRLVSNQKAQFIAAGMSVEEANKKIYGALANSKRSGDAFRVLSNASFAGIVDKSTAAEFAVGNLINTLSKGSSAVNFGREIGVGFEGLINTFNFSFVKNRED
jgi:hypothetical protein